MTEPKVVVLVGCGAAKRRTPVPARDLYTGGLFQKARRWAELHGDAWWILSAEHGLVDPHRVTAPYERKLTPGEAAAFGARVADDLVPAVRALWRHAPVRVVVLAGRDYLRGLDGRLPPSWGVEDPMAGMGIGHRLQWLTREIQRAEAARTPLGRIVG